MARLLRSVALSGPLCRLEEQVHEGLARVRVRARARVRVSWLGFGLGLGLGYLT